MRRLFESMHIFIFLLFFVVWAGASAGESTKRSRKCTPNDSRIIFESCALDYRDMTLWCDLTNLTQLPRPNKIKAVAPPSKSSYLFMNDSCVASLDPGVLREYTRLQSISFSDNLLKFVSDGTFSQHPKLKDIDLSMNKISSIHPDAFKGLKTLARLNLMKNRLTSLDPMVFSNLENLKELFLDRNRFQSLNATSLHFLKRLLLLSLSENKIKRWNKTNGQFREMQTLNLSGNKLEGVSSGDFNRMSKLRTLVLQGNRISEIADDAFEGSSMLTTIDLRDNKLGTLPEGLFKDLCYLRELKLGGNRLTTIQPSMVVSVLRNNEDSFMANELANNHWKCSCGLEDLWMYLQQIRHKAEYQPGEYFALTCHSPAKVSGRNLIDLSYNELCEDDASDSTTSYPQVNTTKSADFVNDSLQSFVTDECRNIRYHEITHNTVATTKAINDESIVSDYTEREAYDEDNSDANTPTVVIIVLVSVSAALLLGLAAFCAFTHRKRPEDETRRRQDGEQGLMKKKEPLDSSVDIEGEEDDDGEEDSTGSNPDSISRRNINDYLEEKKPESSSYQSGNREQNYLDEDVGMAVKCHPPPAVGFISN
ncbi:unnamed protein product [Clavelina lepadiformis]|uniref:Uncharacterized protein n=1 Tax=Clavelina lepadiformis TaxID=159417 RepID=A0ABP0F4N4_CLALP